MPYRRSRFATPTNHVGSTSADLRPCQRPTMGFAEIQLGSSRLCLQLIKVRCKRAAQNVRNSGPAQTLHRPAGNAIVPAPPITKSAMILTSVKPHRRQTRMSMVAGCRPASVQRQRLQNDTRAVTRKSRPASGAKSLRKLAWRRAVTSKMLFAESVRLVGLSCPNGLNATDALTIV